ncbi:tyrosine-type recombinase/integrase [Halorussus marinus]|uniref:tyrosine-type recombinase/integrase n=1 Tax=Halorussus marinus TaxID=2505976 RepID=UPI001091CBCC|nr:site-specific integrase [Halorussus marinus]
MSEDLQPLAPREAMEMWIERQKSEKARETVQSYRYRMDQFVRWCEQEGIENLNSLDGRTLYRFDSHRRGEELNSSTLNNQLGTLRLFLDFCEDIDAVEDGLSRALDVPALTKAERANREKLTTSRAKTIQEKLERFERASVDHALFALAWETGCRLGALHALDVRDCYLEESDIERLAHEENLEEEGLFKEADLGDGDGLTDEVSVPFVFFRHRPESDTPLKNQSEGERPVSLTDELGRILRDFIEFNRPSVEDEYGRRPLFASEKGGGRMSKGGIRRRFYIVTQPCRYGTCPHNRDPDECEALDHGREQRCPSARSPHRIRTGSITWHRDCGWPPEVLAEKVNATPETIRQHYDHPELLRRMESRRSYLDDLE